LKRKFPSWKSLSQYQQVSAVIPVTENTITSGGNWIGICLFTALQKVHTLSLRPRNKIQGDKTTHCVLLKLVISHTKKFQNCSIFRPFWLTKTIGRQLLANQPLFLIFARGICPGYLLCTVKTTELFIICTNKCTYLHLLVQRINKECSVCT
jgi:hypothetical protein